MKYSFSYQKPTLPKGPWAAWGQSQAIQQLCWGQDQKQAEVQYSPKKNRPSGPSLNSAMGGEGPGGAGQGPLVPSAQQACWLVPRGPYRPES